MTDDMPRDKVCDCKQIKKVNFRCFNCGVRAYQEHVSKAGYRKPPQGKPPLLRDEEIQEVIGHLSQPHGHPAVLRKVAEEQLASDRKYYEG